MTRARRRPIRLSAVLAAAALIGVTACGSDATTVQHPTASAPGSTASTATSTGTSPGTADGTPAGQASGGSADPAATHGPDSAQHTGTPAAPGRRPNIVFVLTDDLSSDLVPYMPHVQALMAQGMSFTNYTVTNSLCCPSRASILTGEFPHDTGIVSNVAPKGGWQGFLAKGDEKRTFALALQRAGYRTGFFGKYLNGYDPAGTHRNPPGWSAWGGVGEGGYVGFGWLQSLNGRLVRHGTADDQYVTSVITQQGRAFIQDSARAHRPFALEVASFAPHDPYVPARADRKSFLNLPAPRTPAFDATPKNPVSWLKNRPPLTADQIKVLDQDFRLRVESVQSLDRSVMQLQQTLRATGQLSNTVFVFSSDNGLHLGQYRMTAGKLTAFETDITVPLVVTGPGIPAGSVSAAPVENIDLAPTFEELAGAPIPATVDGHSIVALLHGAKPAWRRYALVEHGNTTPPAGDPDRQPPSSGGLGPYRAIRSTTFTYVEYVNGEREYYDRQTDPYELDNLAGQLPADRIAQLHSIVAALATCHGPTQCWQAAQPASLP